jgi:hypothetical protein
MEVNVRMVCAVLVMFSAMLLAVEAVHAKPMGEPAMTSVGEPAMFIPGTPATDISVARTRCVNGFAVVYFNKDGMEYPTKKACSEATGGTAANSRRVNPTNDGQGGKKCPSGTTEYQNCTPVNPLPCCYTNAN